MNSRRRGSCREQDERGAYTYINVFTVASLGSVWSIHPNMKDINFSLVSLSLSLFVSVCLHLSLSLCLSVSLCLPHSSATINQTNQYDWLIAFNKIIHFVWKTFYCPVCIDDHVYFLFYFALHSIVRPINLVLL